LRKLDDQAVAKALPRAFATIGGEEAERCLLDLLYRGSKRLRVETIRILVETRGVECVDALKPCISDPDPEVSAEAINSLKELTGKFFSPDDAANQASSLIQSTIAPGSSITEAIVVIDLCNSTDITTRYGDSFAMKLLQILTSVVNPVALREQCQFTKGTGDGFLLTFPKAQNAIRFSFDVLSATQELNKKSDKSHQINLRFAINFGESKVDEKGDRLGAAVSMTFRVEGVKPTDAIPADDCLPTEMVPLQNRIFITENIEKEISTIDTLKPQLVGLYELKGITGLHRIYNLTGTL
jgi:class 3 adenylate cyclase